jgi:hypothetical protein
MKTFIKIVGVLLFLAVLAGIGGAINDGPKQSQVSTSDSTAVIAFSEEKRFLQNADSMFSVFSKQDINTIASASLVCGIMNKYRKTISIGITSNDSAFKKLALKCRPKLKAFQKKMYPKCREGILVETHKLIWEIDGKARIEGNNQDELILIAPALIRNAEKKKLVESMWPILNLCRFKHVHCYWYEGSDGSTWTIENYPDSDIEFHENEVV